MNLDAIKEALLASYETDGGINHLDGVNLPSQESVNETAQGLHASASSSGFFEETRLQKKKFLNSSTAACSPASTNAWRRKSRKASTFAKDPNRARARALGSLETLERLPQLRRLIRTDVAAAYEGDPAARSIEEIILAYPCVLTISLQRFAHVLYELGVPLPSPDDHGIRPRAHGHRYPSRARIGTHLFIDHGTGVVKARPRRIGSHVKLYQGVTLVRKII